eukprot:5271419-Lingulodinium_polyedra.AAC.1
MVAERVRNPRLARLLRYSELLTQQDHDPADRWIPAWDGNPASRRTYRGEVRLWATGTRLDVNYV